MEERFSLAEGRGWLTAWETGDKVCLEADLPDDRQGLYKVYLTGRQGRFPLGALVPEGNSLQLRRTLSRRTLEQAGVWPPQGAELSLAYRPGRSPSRSCPEDWREAPDPARLFKDAVLIRAMAQTRRALLRRQEKGFQLALLWPEGTAFPLCPLFCFARLQSLGGERYAVFWFDAEGWPILPL